MMKQSKFISIFITIFIYLLISNLFLIGKFNAIYYLWINPIFWIILFLICMILKKGYKRYKNKINNIQKVIIIVLFYIIIYFLLGLIFGFQYSPYQHDILSVIKNIWQYIVIIIFEEYIRNYFISISKNKVDIILTTILFIFIGINFNALFSNINNMSSLFQYFSSTLLPLIFSNALCTYLCKIGSYKLSLFYKIPIELIYIISPIFPNLNFLLNGFMNIILTALIYVFISYDYQKSEQQLSRIKKQNPFLFVPILLLGIILICFTVGVFKYQPMAILSNSMVPTYSRGDIVVYSKPDTKELENLDLYNIIVYRLDDMIIAHRIVEIQEKNGETLYITKGDNNPTKDSKKVKKQDIIGIVKLTIPFIGYPTVWLNELFN